MLENVYPKLVPTLEPATLASLSHETPCPEPPRQISPEVAHELNNILNIIQGYAAGMILKHGETPALRPELQLISDNARRAVSVVRQATPRKSSAAVMAGWKIFGFIFSVPAFCRGLIQLQM